jgi:hypothetical protein
MVFLIENYMKISQNYAEPSFKHSYQFSKIITKPDETTSTANYFGETNYVEATSRMLTINTSSDATLPHSLSSGYSSLASSSLSSCSFSSVTGSLSYFSEETSCKPRTKSESTATSSSRDSIEASSEDDCFNSLSPNTSEHSATSQEHVALFTNYELISEICAQIEKNQEPRTKCTDLKTSRTFWQYLINKLDMLHLLGRTEAHAFYTSEKNEFIINLSKLLLSITRIEVTLSDKTSTIYQDLDSDALLNLAFLFYEQATLIINTNMMSCPNSVSTQMVFEIDLNISNMAANQSVVKFEKYLNLLTENFLIKYLPELKSDAKIVDFYRDVLSRTQIESFVSVTEQQQEQQEINERSESWVMDVDLFLTKPHALSESIDFLVSNPITQSFKSLLTNLNKLNLCASDPFREASEEANLFGRQMEQLTYACFFLSFYTSGLSSAEEVVVSKASMFDSPMQILYESKQFKGEFESLFKHESINDEWKKSMIESLRGDYEQYVQFYEHDLNFKIKVTRIFSHFIIPRAQAS